MSHISTEEPEPEYKLERKVRTCEDDWKFLRKLAIDLGGNGRALHRMIQVYKQYGHL